MALIKITLLFLCFYFIVFPLGLIFRTIKLCSTYYIKNHLETYWVKKDPIPFSSNYFKKQK